MIKKEVTAWEVFVIKETVGKQFRKRLWSDPHVTRSGQDRCVSERQNRKEGGESTEKFHF